MPDLKNIVEKEVKKYRGNYNAKFSPASQHTSIQRPMEIVYEWSVEQFRIALTTSFHSGYREGVEEARDKVIKLVVSNNLEQGFIDGMMRMKLLVLDVLAALASLKKNI